MARDARRRRTHGLGFVWYSARRLSGEGWRLAIRLANGDQEEWGRLGKALEQTYGCRCILQAVIQNVFALFLRRLLTGVTVSWCKAQAAIDKSSRKHLDAIRKLRRERQAREAAEHKARKVMEMEELRRKATPTLACAICFSTENLMVLIPCGHACVCEPCQPTLQTCPLCRDLVVQAIRVYF